MASSPVTVVLVSGLVGFAACWLFLVPSNKPKPVPDHQTPSEKTRSMTALPAGHGIVYLYDADEGQAWILTPTGMRSLPIEGKAPLGFISRLGNGPLESPPEDPYTGGSGRWDEHP